MGKQKILIAHSDSDLVTLLQMMLEDDFEVSTMKTAEELKKASLICSFDIVLLDTELPDTSGLELCFWIKDNCSKGNLPVFFLSKDDDEETIRTAYANGAYDYLCLPINIVAFHAHILRFSTELQTLKALEEKDRAFSGVAETAMKQASFYGQGLELTSALNFAQDEVDMAKLVGKTFTGLGIACAMQFRSSDGDVTLDAEGQQCDEMEMRIFELLNKQGRIYHFGRRCIFNDEHTSVLIKTMPQEGTSTYDAVLDMVAKFVPALGARLMSISQQRSMEATKSSLMDILQVVNSSFDMMQQEKITFINNIESKIALSFGKLDLQEYQEKAIVDLVENELRESGESDIMVALRQKVEECIDGVQVEPNKAADTNLADTANTDDIELF